MKPESFEGKLIHKRSGQDAGVHVTVFSRQLSNDRCLVVWAANLAMPDGIQRTVNRHEVGAPPHYEALPIEDLAEWLLVPELGSGVVGTGTRFST